jgi:hypothetical protein
VSIAANPRINDWLTLLESEIRQTLASLLAQSVSKYNQLAKKITKSKDEAFLKMG